MRKSQIKDKNPNFEPIKSKLGDDKVRIKTHNSEIKIQNFWMKCKDYRNESQNCKTKYHNFKIKNLQ